VRNASGASIRISAYAILASLWTLGSSSRSLRTLTSLPPTAASAAWCHSSGEDLRR